MTAKDSARAKIDLTGNDDLIELINYENGINDTKGDKKKESCCHERCCQSSKISKSKNEIISWKLKACKTIKIKI